MKFNLLLFICVLTVTFTDSHSDAHVNSKDIQTRVDALKAKLASLSDYLDKLVVEHQNDAHHDYDYTAKKPPHTKPVSEKRDRFSDSVGMKTDVPFNKELQKFVEELPANDQSLVKHYASKVRQSLLAALHRKDTSEVEWSQEVSRKKKQMQDTDPGQLAQELITRLKIFKQAVETAIEQQDLQQLQVLGERLDKLLAEVIDAKQKGYNPQDLLEVLKSQI